MYMAIMAPVPATKVEPGVQERVYPIALKNSEIRFKGLFTNLSEGVLEQRYTFSELEANAMVYKYFGKRKNFPIKEPYIFFLDDTVRLRFDLSLFDAGQILKNQLSGTKLKDNLGQVIASNKTSKRISFTIDFGIVWHDKYPEISVKHVYIGVLPVPLASMINASLGRMNERLRITFGKTLARGDLYIREFKVIDKLLVVKFEAKATDVMVKRAELARIRNENADVFETVSGRADTRCKYGCTDKEKQAISNYIDKITERGKITDEDIKKAKELMNPKKKK